MLGRKKRDPGPSGIRVPPPPQDGGTPAAIAFHYLSFYEADYARARTLLKRRAQIAVVTSAVLTGLIGVTGALVAVWEQPMLGVVSTAFAAAIGAISAWDGLFRHRDLWVQRSVVLGQLQQEKRRLELRLALGEEPSIVGTDAMNRLNDVLSHDLEMWSQLREREQPQITR